MSSFKAIPANHHVYSGVPDAQNSALTLVEALNRFLRREFELYHTIYKRAILLRISIHTTKARSCRRTTRPVQKHFTPLELGQKNAHLACPLRNGTRRWPAEAGSKGERIYTSSEYPKL